jgi:hypothetical protein
MHVGVLWVGATIACVAVFRTFGKYMGELALVATRAQYSDKSLASHLLRWAAAEPLSSKCHRMWHTISTSHMRVLAVAFVPLCLGMLPLPQCLRHQLGLAPAAGTHTSGGLLFIRHT